MGAGLMLVIGKVSSEEKALLLDLFQNEFHKTEKEASDLLMSSIYLFGDGDDALTKPEKILRNTLDSFNEEKARSVMSLLNSIKKIDNKNQDSKEGYIKKVETVFEKNFKSDSQW